MVSAPFRNSSTEPRGSARSWEQILQILKTTSDPYDMVYCHATLKEIGSVKSIPYLQKNLDSKKKDVKASARSAIKSIEARAKRNS